MSSITAVVRARSCARLAISRTPKTHTKCDVKQCKTCTLCTFLEYKVHLIKTGLNALVYELWPTLYLPHHR